MDVPVGFSTAGKVITMAVDFSYYEVTGVESAAVQAKVQAAPGVRTPAITIDTRTLSPTNRNAKIFEAFDRLAVGAVLELTGEADPRSLRNEFAQCRAGRFSWDARNLGSAACWTIRLARIDLGY